MNDKYRVLAYKKALDVRHEELAEVSGGAALLTVKATQRLYRNDSGFVNVTMDYIPDN